MARRQHVPSVCCKLSLWIQCPLFLSSSLLIDEQPAQLPQPVLGGLPQPSQLSDVPLIPPTSSQPGPIDWSTRLVESDSVSTPHSVPSPPLVLTSLASPFPGRLVDRIRSGQFVEMRELLSDNMALFQLLETAGRQATNQQYLTASRPARPREITSLTTWVNCFLAYCAIGTSDMQTRDRLTYARLVIREALQYGGNGWAEYDRVFRQQTAIDPSLPWNNLDPSLVASTFLGSQTERMAFCQFCREVDHNWEECALRSIRDPLSMSNTTPIPGPSDPQSEGRQRRRQAIRPRPETLDRICVSWNKGRCAYPGSCTFRHRCATCRQPGHMARDCADTRVGVKHLGLKFKASLSTN